MRVFLDTSVLVAASVKAHPQYFRSRPVLEAIHAGQDVGVMSAHSLAECYSALTSIAVDPRIQPAEAQQLIGENIRRRFRIQAVTEQMYLRAVECCVRQGLPDGPVYDALLLECARQANVERIYTFNVVDFRGLAPDLPVVAP